MPWPFEAAAVSGQSRPVLSQMELRMRDHRWEDTPVGPVASWPNSLKAAVRLILDCQLPAHLAWGDSFTQFYNDAYISIMGDKHPAALGSDARASWPEVWPTVGPMWEQVWRGEPIGADDLELTINRHGYPETCYFAYSYSPVYGDGGNVEGVLSTVVETTRNVLAERRQSFQLKLDEVLRTNTRPDALLNEAISLWSQYFRGARLSFADVQQDGRSVVIRETWQDGAPIALAVNVLSLDEACFGCAEQVMCGETVCVASSGAGTASTSGMAIPLIDGGKLLSIGLMHGDDVHRWTHEERALAEAGARRTWEALRRIRAEHALVEETRVLELLNRSGASLASTLDLRTLLQSITDAATQLTGAQFGAFFYNGTDANGEAYSLYTLSGAPRSAFENFGYPRPTPVFKSTFFGGPPVRSDDITKDPRYGQVAPHFGMPPGHLPVCSYLATSVFSRSGDVLGGLFFGHSEPGMFDERTERIIVGFAAQAAVAIDNARLYELAQRVAQEREALLASERAARGEAERHNKMKDEFLAMLAHELRNPLAPITNAAHLLKLKGVDESVRMKASTIIDRQVRHMTELIDDLLDVSRVTRGLIKLDKEVFDLKTVVLTAVEQARPVIEARQHTLSVDMPDAVVPVFGDRTRLTQVLVNLLNNAAKFTPQEGQVRLSLGLEDAHARLTVHDNGCGIEPHVLPHIFDLFTQGERTPDRAQGGLGIGLALVKRLVLMHSGRVEASSEGTGRGSAVSVILPLADGGQSSAHSQPALRVEEAGSLVITLVDDNVDAAQTLAVLLRAKGHEVHVFDCGEAALASAHLAGTEVFILDIGLPDMTGYELARRLRRGGATQDAVFIALTGYGQASDRELSVRAGFRHHMVKPADIAMLDAMLAEARAQGGHRHH